ncbi:prolyl-tRNA synthetase associated domain-containing protein [Acuticoccus sp. I52.16.1]|uniref:prolyl-tRNA synthetase associated domain-containing protein n=1 Tax=Acuticoccus sp. I52.16.1 TaxID=2928472 RepID=UPI001FD32DDE|nr:prolyl-tRNA synthetase associated domain-containing protein [Acuticoccus sp. I52.16.1]UOM36416.1 prolyl-tRNA synthetase associated domain-containing protein [Acuticoccus sp. I52.16.1]
MSEGASPDAAPRGFDRLAEAFAALGIDPPTVEHEAAFTVDSAVELRGTIPGLHTKNLFLKDKKGAYFLVTAPEDAAIDLKRIHTVIGAKGRVSFGSAEAMVAMLGVTPGSVTPLALINDDAGTVRCIFHQALGEADLINVHPLRNTATVTLARAELFEILRRAGHEPDVMTLPAPDADA